MYSEEVDDVFTNVTSLCLKITLRIQNIFRLTIISDSECSLLRLTYNIILGYSRYNK